MNSLKKKFTIITLVYWVLLLYIIAALIWWFISLERQNHQMFAVRVAELNPAAADYQAHLSRLETLRNRKTTQYVGEGVTFLVLILVGAVFVYRAARRQIRLSQQQQNFMMAITHELKTPVAVVQLNLETLQKRRLEPEKQERLVKLTLQEASRLNELCNNILFAAQLDAGLKTFSTEWIDFSALVEESVQAFRERLPGRRVEAELQPGVQLRGEPMALKILVNNLIENAVKYSPRDGTIQVTVGSNPKQVCFSVADEGAGISAEEKNKVFEKFYRSGNENTRQAKGTGLGLYIARRIALDHHATIHIEDNKPRGSVFKVAFRL